MFRRYGLKNTEDTYTLRAYLADCIAYNNDEIDYCHKKIEELTTENLRLSKFLTCVKD